MVSGTHADRISHPAAAMAPWTFCCSVWAETPVVRVIPVVCIGAATAVRAVTVVGVIVVLGAAAVEGNGVITCPQMTGF